jgi:phosphatidylserine/phosphatidylglycerophosphate/cardiolipin synthase-like enzyme
MMYLPNYDPAYFWGPPLYYPYANAHQLPVDPALDRNDELPVVVGGGHRLLRRRGQLPRLLRLEPHSLHGVHHVGLLTLRNALPRFVVHVMSWFNRLTRSGKTTKACMLGSQFYCSAKKAQGVDVQVLGHGRLGGLLAHGKLTIVDGRIAAIGSVAQTAMSLDFRREIAVTVEEPKCVRKLKDFYRLLASGRELMDPAKAAGFVRVK